MKIYKTISTSKDGAKKEVVAEEDGNYFTKHIHKADGRWRYLKSRDKQGKLNFGSIDNE
jgi:hypothetical protein